MHNSNFKNLTFSILLVIFSVTGCNGGVDSGEDNQQKEEKNWKIKADMMIENQIKARGISDNNVIKSLKNVPRQKFVPEEYNEYAWSDGPVPIGYNQTISQPYIVALMTSELDLKGNEKVLEIGTGSGYQAAVLANIVDQVYSIEIVDELAESSEKLLKKLDYNNVKVKNGNGYKGWEEYAPYDRIIVTAAPPEIPDKLTEQLKPGGIMILPVGKTNQKLKKLKKTDQGDIKEETVTMVRFVPMINPGK